MKFLYVKLNGYLLMELLVGTFPYSLTRDKNVIDMDATKSLQYYVKEQLLIVEAVKVILVPYEGN